MKRILTIFLLLYSITSFGQDIKHGVSFGGGLGYINSSLKSSQKISNHEISYLGDFFIGYKARLNPRNNYFFDLGVNVGMINWKSSYDFTTTNLIRSDATSQYYYLSLEGLFNYKIYKEFYTGLGISPSYFFYEEDDINKGKNKFDIPIVARIGYIFSKFDLAITYKQGILNVLETEYLKSGRFGSFNLSIFIPF